MKNKSEILCKICHDAIYTQAVFFDNNQVYQKNASISSKEATESAEWFPINFQWIPVLQLNRNLNHQSNTSSK